jgi:hypothetical protein
MVKHNINELLICDRCGAIVAIGKYRPLSRPGRDVACMADMRSIPAEQADKMLENYLPNRNASRKQEGEKP